MQLDQKNTKQPNKKILHHLNLVGAYISGLTTLNGLSPCTSSKPTGPETPEHGKGLSLLPLSLFALLLQQLCRLCFSLPPSSVSQCWHGFLGALLWLSRTNEKNWRGREGRGRHRKVLSALSGVSNGEAATPTAPASGCGHCSARWLLFSASFGRSVLHYLALQS